MLEVETGDRILRLDGDGLLVLGLYAWCDPDDRRAFPSRVDEQLHEVRLSLEDAGLHRYPAVEGDRCPACGRPLCHTPDVLDELVQTVIDERWGVEHVVAAALPFTLPPHPAG